jgi:catechol 2,3-dioxygenase-like lactoylglutathione lyase family enzyme
MTKKPWNKEVPAVQFRIARPTNKLKEVIQFYEKGIGLAKIGGFENHNGYDGVMFGLPGFDHHLEFTSHVNGSPCPAPTKDNLLVFYIPDHQSIEKIKERLEAMGYPEVEPENPYWKNKGITIEDPDGWRIVLMNTEGIG